MLRKNQGFTIVELLIVIVVVAILATLAYTTYTNVVNRAHDSAVKSDLTHLGKAVSMVVAEQGKVPAPTFSAVKSLNVTITKQSYSTDGYISGNGPYNLIYCTSEDGDQYGFVGWSKSGKGFAYRMLTG